MKLNDLGGILNKLGMKGRSGSSEDALSKAIAARIERDGEGPVHGDEAREMWNEGRGDEEIPSSGRTPPEELAARLERFRLKIAERMAGEEAQVDPSSLIQAPGSSRYAAMMEYVEKPPHPKGGDLASILSRTVKA